MNVLVFDTESNGLLDEATEVWCAVTKVNEVVTQYILDDTRRFIDTLSNLGDDTIICAHNLIEHDLPLLEKIYGYRHEGRVLDTLVMSRLLQPERVGRHGLGAWGERFGRSKPAHEDWSFYNPEMLHRCTEDVEINSMVYTHLMKEAEMDEEELAQLPSY